MPTSTSSVLFAASLCVAAAAQQQASTAAPAPDATANAGGGGGASHQPPAAAVRFESLRAELQDTDYTLRGLFQQEHGDFMLRRERFNPMIEISGSSLTSASVSSEPGHFDEYHIQVDAEVPITVATDAYVTLGGFYESRHYNTRNMPGFLDENLYSAGAKLGFGWFVDKEVLIEGKVEPGTWSDWDGTLHHQDFDFPAGLLATVRYSNEFFWKVGVRYNEVFEDAEVLPWLGFSWVGESIRVDMLLPENLEVSLWPSTDFGILLGAQIEGAEYHVRSSQATGHQEGDARVQEAVIYAGALWRMNDYTSLGARIGAAVAGDYKLDDGDASTARVTGTLDPSLFVEISFGIDF